MSEYLDIVFKRVISKDDKDKNTLLVLRDNSEAIPQLEEDNYDLQLDCLQHPWASYTDENHTVYHFDNLQKVDPSKYQIVFIDTLVASQNREAIDELLTKIPKHTKVITMSILPTKDEKPEYDLKDTLPKADKLFHSNYGVYRQDVNLDTYLKHHVLLNLGNDHQRSALSLTKEYSSLSHPTIDCRVDYSVYYT